MSSDVAIRIEGLGKAYRIKHQEQQITLAEQALQRLRHPLHRAPVETFWALSGRRPRDRPWRGSRADRPERRRQEHPAQDPLADHAPDDGPRRVYGRVGSLLEVGTGFHPELTGRENVYLNGSILGMRKPEIDRQFDAIVDFAGVEQFLDTPVKRYSSGMYVRLAFAVAAHLETEILLVDEVLAVGDQEFQDKCLGKMRDVTTAGRTVILVSHNLPSVGQLADRCVLLDGGLVAATGDTEEVLAEYRTLIERGWELDTHGGPATRARMTRIKSVRIVGSSAINGSVPFTFDAEVDVFLESASHLAVGLYLRHLGRPEWVRPSARSRSTANCLEVFDST